MQNGAPPHLTASETYQQAIAHHQRGDLDTAERLYRAILLRQSNHAPSVRMLGMLARQRGQAEAAEALLGQAISLDPKVAAFHSDLGDLYLDLGRFAEAAACLERALTLEPELAGALNNHGNALQGLGRHGEALASYGRALTLKPGYAKALHNRGDALRRLGRLDEALADYAAALSAQPDLAESANAAGLALQQLGRPEEALVSIGRALIIRPAFPDALNNAALVLTVLGRAPEALEASERALALAPDFAEALNHRGLALAALGRAEDALASYARARAVHPGLAQAAFNHANLLWRLQRSDEALAAFAAAAYLEPANPEFANAQANALLNACDWRGYAGLMAAITADAEAGRATYEPFLLLSASDSPALQLKSARAHHRAKFPVTPPPLRADRRYGHDKIRLAYVSSDLHVHAIGQLVVGLFERHDRERFHLTAISTGPDTASSTRSRIKAGFDDFVDARALSDQAVADYLAARETDIAVDLNGLTGSSRPGIFARRPAPVQVNFLGYPGTLGRVDTDYIIADPIITPNEHRQFYAEKVVRLPHAYQPNDDRRPPAGPAPTRAEVGLPEQGLVFCSFNANYKITPTVFDVWMRLLTQVPDSVLWLLESNPTAAANLRREAAARGVDPARLVSAPRVSPEAHLARHRLAGLFLDTSPVGAHTTASDALWAGLPVLTILGGAFVSRVAASLVTAAGLSDLAVANLADYEGTALALARDATRLAELAARLERGRTTSPLFDTARFARHIEAAYARMHQRAEQGLAPQAFDVDPEPAL